MILPQRHRGTEDTESKGIADWMRSGAVFRNSKFASRASSVLVAANPKFRNWKKPQITQITQI
jgi:hypothetical protein